MYNVDLGLEGVRRTYRAVVGFPRRAIKGCGSYVGQTCDFGKYGYYNLFVFEKDIKDSHPLNPHIHTSMHQTSKPERP